MKLLFLLCYWHGLAKLHMHTDDTLGLMELVTVMLGNHLCTFTSETCTAFSTKELCHKAEARTRCQSRETLLKQGTPSSRENNTQAPAARRVKTLNLQTYKLHALGDYTELIRTYGMTDSYSTQPVSYECSLLCSSSKPFDSPGRTWALCWKKLVLLHQPKRIHPATCFDWTVSSMHLLYPIKGGCFASRAKGKAPQ